MMVLSSRHRKENAVKRFAHQYNELITGMISCFDRIVFKGCLPIGRGDAVEGFLGQQGGPWSRAGVSNLCLAKAARG